MMLQCEGCRLAQECGIVPSGPRVSWCDFCQQYRRFEPPTSPIFICRHCGFEDRFDCGESLAPEVTAYCPRCDKVQMFIRKAFKASALSQPITSILCPAGHACYIIPDTNIFDCHKCGLRYSTHVDGATSEPLPYPSPVAKSELRLTMTAGEFVVMNYKASIEYRDHNGHTMSLYTRIRDGGTCGMEQIMQAYALYYFDSTIGQNKIPANQSIKPTANDIAKTIIDNILGYGFLGSSYIKLKNEIARAIEDERGPVLPYSIARIDAAIDSVLWGFKIPRVDVEKLRGMIKDIFIDARNSR